MKKIIITGALGQDGIILSKIMLKKKFKVIGLIRNIKKRKIKKVTYIKINLLNFSKLCKFLDKIKPDIIVHFGSDNPSYGSNFSSLFYKRNFKIFINLVNYVVANKKIKLLFSNSSQIFSQTKKKVNENSKIHIKDFYTKFRIKSSKYLMRMKKKHKLNCTNLILFNHDSKYRNKRFVLPRIMFAIKNKNYNFLKHIYKENIMMDFSHADDICYGIYLLIKKNKNPNNLILSSSKISSLNSLIENYVNKKINLKYVKIKTNNRGVIGTNTKARKLLSWKPKKNLFVAADEIYKNL
tara:strand:+ start:1823 stop:2707 length:885 start_codon:yes stop_codon:yes gene_type:complete